MYTLLGDFVVQTSILTNLLTAFNTGMEITVQKAINTKQEVEDVIPKKEALSEFLNEHYVGIEDNDNDNSPSICMTNMIVRIQ